MALDSKPVNGKKRKQAPVAEPVVEEALPEVGLDMLSDEEEAEVPAESDDEGFDEFPEIDARSDSEKEEEDEDGEDEIIEGEEDEDEGIEESEEDDEVSTDDDLHIFPKAKTVITDITGQPKTVYPEIEPDYDSDSSTEDVRTNVTPLL